MRRREPGRAAGPAELEALDPLTGDSLVAEASASASASPSLSPAKAVARANRFRRLSRLLAVLAIVCGAAAGYFGATIAQLRGVERTWRTAIAVDHARAVADTEVLDILADVGGDDEDAARQPLSEIGDEAAEYLASAERELSARRILDSKVSALRDQMVEALEFRRFQLTPQRAQMGDTPLRKVDREIDAQLNRWGLTPAVVDEPALESVPGVLDTLRRFTDDPTGVTLMGVTSDRVLVTIDVDESLARRRDLGPGPVVGFFPARGGAAVWDGGKVTVYPADDDASPVAEVPANRGVFEVNDDSGDLWVVEAVAGSTATKFLRRFRPVAGATLQDPVPVPTGKQALGGAGGRLVLFDVNSHALELYTPPTADAAASTVVLSTGPARFLDGDARRVLWQGPLPFGDFDSDGYLHLLDLSTSKRELLALPPTDASTGSLADDGAIAIAAGPFAGRIGSILVADAGTAALVGIDGPRASVRGNAPQWSPDGELLFWLTPDGRVAMRRGTGREAFNPVSSTMRTGLEDLAWLVLLDR